MDSITIKDVARICGVGVSTVSRAINNHPDINPETKNRILQVIREYDYIPNNSARNLKRTVSRSIVVLIKGIDNPFFSSMIRIIEAETQKARYSFILHRVDLMEDEMDVAMEVIKEKKPKGIIFLGGYFSHSYEKLKKLDVPFVLVTIAIADPKEREQYSSVSVDDFQESYKMVSYLCSQGHTRIGILAADEGDESIGKLRFEGYLKALRDHGIRPDPRLFFHSAPDAECYTMGNGYRLMNRVLASGEDMTALFAVSDSIAIGACKAVFDAGKSVPEDYSIAGFDGLDMAQYYNPSITTIRQPVEDMALAAIRLLFDVIHDSANNRQQVFKGQLIEGNSIRRIENG